MSHKANKVPGFEMENFLNKSFHLLAKISRNDVTVSSS